MNFHETICGRRFFDAQLPHLIKALERIADGLTQPKMSLPHGMTIEPNFLHDLYEESCPEAHPRPPVHEAGETGRGSLR